MTLTVPTQVSKGVTAMERDSPDLSVSSGRDSASEGDSSGEVFRGESERQLRAMCVDILRSDRDYPIVGLTCRPGARDPALPVDRVRASIWQSVPIYVIEPQQARAAHAVLPDRLGAYNGAARVWWPGVADHSDQSWHPLIYDSTGVYGDDALRRLAIEFERQCPSPINLSPEQQLILNERLRARSERRCREMEERVRELERQCRNLEQHPPTSAAHAVKASSPTASQDTEPPTNEKVERRGDGERLYVLIVEKWVETFSGPHDWSESPLASFVFSNQFLRDLDDPDRLPLERIAWVCAMVACGKARGLGGIDPHQLLTGDGGRQLVREDGAKGWRCNLKRNSPGGARLHYWIHPSGRIEFGALGNHDLRGEL
jgi:hypothetical protein